MCTFATQNTDIHGMKTTGKIMISIALLLMTLYGGGVCISHCACSGDATIYHPGDDGCCPEEDCMTVTVVQFTDEYPATHPSMPQIEPIVMEAPYAIYRITFNTNFLPTNISSKSPPDWEAQYSMVMTV